MQQLRFSCAVILATCVMACAPEQPSATTTDPSSEGQALTPLMEIDADALRTTHSLKYTISAGEGFRLTAVNTREDVFNNTPYLISRAAFIGDGEAAMIHAETVTDQSNASNYDNLPEATWPNSSFRSEGLVCFEIGAEDIENEADPQWLISNGFSPIGTLMLSQAFLSSADYNDEIVVSLFRLVESCDAASNEQEFERLQSAINVIAH